MLVRSKDGGDELTLRDTVDGRMKIVGRPITSMRLMRENEERRSGSFVMHK